LIKTILFQKNNNETMFNTILNSCKIEGWMLLCNSSL